PGSGRSICRPEKPAAVPATRPGAGQGRPARDKRARSWGGLRLRGDAAQHKGPAVRVQTLSVAAPRAGWWDLVAHQFREGRGDELADLVGQRTQAGPQLPLLR